ncbi:hypothetical protein PHLCEN_2v8477 [Hermanssonia centrifuga]|uniref:ferric-chelate reductase (NADPH) n=1 Tax=Hermanssonia centrifuga TaxID=98765 RepID=A0A2R6NTI6_9APHY|nr:hypothetical protein PHLCEN_2v8477 [Hermanssonia centrifuga]
MSSPVVAAAIPSVSTLKSAAQTSTAGFDNANLVFNVDLFLVAFVALFFLLSLPRAVVRYTHSSEWFDGQLLRYVTLSKSRRSHRPETLPAPLTAAHTHTSRTPTPTSTDWLNDSEKYMDNGGYTSASHAVLNRSGSGSSQAHLLRNYSSSSGRARRAHLNLQSHMPNWTTMLPQLSWITRISLRPGLTIGGASILIAYFAVMLYAGLYMSNPFTQPLRTGYVAISQIPVVILLATKVNVLGMLLGAAYTRLNYLHRFAGRLLVLAVNIHAIGYFYSWSLAGTFTTQMAKPMHVYGFVALLAADALILFSTDFMRRQYYGTFIVMHVIGVVTFLVTVFMHSTDSAPYILFALAAYMFDRLMRLVKTRYTVARLCALSELNMTRVEVQGINAGWRAGQHVRLRILSRGLGLFGWMECHPFTIASVSKSHNGEGLILMCKKTGMWTSRLYDLARRAEYSEANGYSQEVKVLVEGPYGGPGHTLYSSFSGALLVAGGSGITFALGVLQDLLQKDLEGRSRLKCIELVWSVQDPSAVLPLLPLFSALLAQSSSRPYYTTVNISVSYTRCFSNPPEHVSKTLSRLPPGLTVTPGRPKLQSTLASVVDRACALFHRGRENVGAPAGVLVTVCGPQGLAEDVRKAVRRIEPERRKRAGGVELHDE